MRGKIAEIIRGLGYDGSGYASKILSYQIEEIKKVENKPSQYHYVCWASGAVKVRDEWGKEPTYQCRFYDGDFNCGYRGCKDGIIEGVKELTDIERHENWMVQKIIKKFEAE